MAKFISAMASDPAYQGRNAPTFINVDLLARIHPNYCEIKDGVNFRCANDHKNATLVSYTLTDIRGNEYEVAAETIDDLRILPPDENQTPSIMVIGGED